VDLAGLLSLCYRAIAISPSGLDLLFCTPVRHTIRLVDRCTQSDRTTRFDFACLAGVLCQDLDPRLRRLTRGEGGLGCDSIVVSRRGRASPTVLLTAFSTAINQRISLLRVAPAWARRRPCLGFTPKPRSKPLDLDRGPYRASMWQVSPMPFVRSCNPTTGVEFHYLMGAPDAAPAKMRRRDVPVEAESRFGSTR
jgi:hypothetical protein